MHSASAKPLICHQRYEHSDTAESPIRRAAEPLEIKCPGIFDEESTGTGTTLIAILRYTEGKEVRIWGERMILELSQDQTKQFPRERSLRMLSTKIVTREVTGVDQELRDRLITTLNQDLASLTDLAAAYKQAHWNVVGINFSQVHEVFDEFSDQVRESIDLIAERAVTLGGVARGTVQAAAKDSVLPPFSLEERDEVRLLEEMLARLDIMTSKLRVAMDESAVEAVTQDIYIEVLGGLEKQRWMLQAHLTQSATHA